MRKILASAAASAMFLFAAAAQAMDLSAPVLVVHSSSTKRAIVKRYMTGLGFTQIQQASDGKAAVEMLKSSGAQVVISGWNVFDVSLGDGKFLLETIRSGGAGNSSTPVVVLFEDSDSTAVMSGAANLGMTTSLKGSFNDTALKAALVKALGQF